MLGLFWSKFHWHKSGIVLMKPVQRITSVRIKSVPFNWHPPFTEKRQCCFLYHTWMLFSFLCFLLSFPHSSLNFWSRMKTIQRDSCVLWVVVWVWYMHTTQANRYIKNCVNKTLTDSFCSLVHHLVLQLGEIISQNVWHQFATHCYHDNRSFSHFLFWFGYFLKYHLLQELALSEWCFPPTCLFKKELS